MKTKWYEDTTPHKRWVDRLGLVLMLIVDVALLVLVFQEAGWSDLDPRGVRMSGAALVYGGALTYGWACVRLKAPREYTPLGHTAVWILLLQALVYAVLWGGRALGWGPDVLPIGSAILLFLFLGPLAGVQLVGVARRGVPLMLAQILGVLLFIAIMALD